MLLSAKVTQKHFCQLRQQKCRPTKNGKPFFAGFAPCRGLFRPYGRGDFTPPYYRRFPAFCQDRNNAMSVISATLQSSRTQFQDCKILILCIVALLPFSVRHCPILSSSQYHVLFIRFARIPNSFFAFSSVRFDMPCSSATLKILLLCMEFFVSASSRSSRFACSILFALGAIPPNTSSAVIS